MKTKKREKFHPDRRSFALPLAIVSYVLMLVGLVAVVTWGVGLVQGLLNRTAAKQEYEQLISPVVMTDPIPFEDITTADNDFILEASLWAALTGSNRENYTYDDMGLLLVPASDVSVAATRLFGPTVTVEHQSFEDVDGTYLYDPEIAAYRVPSITKSAYSPSVTEISKNGDEILLTVGYVAPGNVWSTQQQTTSGDPTPEKYMVYRLLKASDGSRYVAAVRDTDRSTTANS